MGDRFFLNKIPDFTSETTHGAPSSSSSSSSSPSPSSEAAEDSVTKLLHLPHKAFSERLKKTALDLKETIVRETWVDRDKRAGDYKLYTGALGTAFLFFKAYQVANNKNDLVLCSEIVNSCYSASRDSGRVTFINGQAGVYAIGAVVAKHSGDERLSAHYLAKFKEIKLPRDLPNELFYGRAGYLWACLFLNKNFGKDTVPSTRTRAIVDEIIKAGRQLAKRRCPLMYEWHGKKYWGAAHGLAGILQVLLEMDLKPDEIEDVKGTLNYMIKNRFPSGNYPSSEGSESDRLVQWCHGAPGVALTLVKAAEIFGGEEFLQAAKEASDVVWNRGLSKRVGLCHGISGNTYAFLSLYRLTGHVKYLYRAKAFACFLHENAERLISEGIMHGGDRPHSLFEGIAGMAYLFLDITEPSSARFPAYEL